MYPPGSFCSSKERVFPLSLLDKIGRVTIACGGSKKVIKYQFLSVPIRLFSRRH